MRSFVKLLSVVTVMLTIPAFAHAQITIDPVRVKISPEKPVGVVKISSGAKAGSAPQIFQIIAVEWIDSNDPSKIGPTKAFHVQPKVFKLGSGKTQVIRVTPKDRRIIGGAKKFRLLARSLGSQQSNPNSVKLNVMHNLPILFPPFDK